MEQKLYGELTRVEAQAQVGQPRAHSSPGPGNKAPSSLVAVPLHAHILAYVCCCSAERVPTPCRRDGRVEGAEQAAPGQLHSVGAAQQQTPAVHPASTRPGEPTHEDAVAHQRRGQPARPEKEPECCAAFACRAPPCSLLRQTPAQPRAGTNPCSSTHREPQQVPAAAPTQSQDWPRSLRSQARPHCLRPALLQRRAWLQTGAQCRAFPTRTATSGEAIALRSSIAGAIGPGPL